MRNDFKRPTATEKPVNFGRLSTVWYVDMPKVKKSLKSLYFASGEVVHI